MTPSPLTLLVLALAVFRLWRLLALDTLPQLVWLRDKAVGYILLNEQLAKVRERKLDAIERGSYTEAAHARDEEARLVKEQGQASIVRRPLLAEWLVCPWCSGLWVSVAVYGAWLLWPHGSLYVAVPLAISAAVGLLGHITAD